MRWEDTEIRCRYSECAEEVFGEADIIWYNCVSDYQGHCELIARMPDGRFAHYSWSYGSCSGCDTWEAQGLTDDQIVEAIRQDTAWYPDAESLLTFAEKADLQDLYDEEACARARKQIIDYLQPYLKKKTPTARWDDLIV
jgi:hypothetical protein